MRRARRHRAAACAIGASAFFALAPAAEAEVSSVVLGKVLNITGSDGKDRARVTCDKGSAKVNGSNPVGGAVNCSAIVEVDATMGGGPDLIDFSGITSDFGEARFPGFGVGTGTAALGQDGNDRYVPSRVAFNVFFGGARQRPGSRRPRARRPERRRGRRRPRRSRRPRLADRRGRRRPPGRRDRERPPHRRRRRRRPLRRTPARTSSEEARAATSSAEARAATGWSAAQARTTSGRRRQGHGDREGPEAAVARRTPQ